MITGTEHAIDPDALEDVVSDLGLLIGLFRDTNGQLTLNEKWFKDPSADLAQIPANPKLFTLLKSLLGDASAQALGAPRSELDRQWIPLRMPAEGGGEAKPTGLYVVIYKPEGGATVVGLGMIRTFAEGSLEITPYIFFPLLQLPASAGASAAFVLGKKGHPVELGIELNGGRGAFSAGQVSFDGLSAGVSIPFDGQPPSLEMLFLHLALPGENAANRSLQELIKHPEVEEWLKLAFSVLGAKLAAVEPGSGAIFGQILALLGLTGKVPAIDWPVLLADPRSAGPKLAAWLRSIASDPALLQTWLQGWLALFNPGGAGGASLSGAGTRPDPFSVPLLTIKDKASIALNLATQSTAGGVLTLYPGLRVASAPVSPKGLAVAAQVTVTAELLALELPAAGHQMVPPSPFPSCDLLVELANLTAGKPLISDRETLQVDTLEVGFQYPGSGGDLPEPSLRLNGVRTSIGSWPVVDLSNFNADTLEKELAPVVKAAVEKLLGMAGGGQPGSAAAGHLAAVMGLLPPASYHGTWPVREMLLSAAALPLLVAHPLAALGAYTSRCLAAPQPGADAVWKDLLPELAALLGGSGTTVSGSGTADDPWLSELHGGAAGDPTTSLRAWTAGQELTLGLEIAVPLPLSALSADFDLVVDLLKLDLPSAGGAGGGMADWGSGFEARLTVAKPSAKLQTPSLAGVSLELEKLLLRAGWHKGQGLGWQATIEQITLESGSDQIALGDLVFGAEATSWQSDLEKFAQAIINTLGLILLRHGGRFGTALATILGTLPDLPGLLGHAPQDEPFELPQGITLPSDWPVFHLAHPSNPWSDVETQLTAVLGGGSGSVLPLMQLLGWSISGTVPPLPSPAPAGTYEDPYWVHLADVWDLEVLIWSLAGQQAGFGVRKEVTAKAAADIQLTVNLRLDLPGLLLSSQQPAQPVAPSSSVSCTLTNPTPGQPLVEAGGASIGQAQLTVCFVLRGTTFDIVPGLILTDARLSPGGPAQTVELSPIAGSSTWTCAQGMQLMETLLGTLMTRLSGSAASFPELATLLRLLDLLQLLQTNGSGHGQTVYGFNAASWQALLANPGSFFSARMAEILENADQSSAFFKDLACLIGLHSFQLPSGLDGLQSLLSALGLYQSSSTGSGGCVPVGNWLALLHQPVSYLETRAADLFKDPAVRQKLISQLSRLAPVPGKPFQVDSTGTRVSLAISPDTPIKIGPELQLSGELVLDLKALDLRLEALLASQALGSGLSFQYAPVFTGGHLEGAPAFLLAAAPGPLPAAFEPLEIYPIPGDPKPTLDRLAVQIPLVALAAFSSVVINRWVLGEHPLALRLFQTLGLTVKAGPGKPEQVRPLLSIFQHPAAWLLGPQAMGDAHGNLDLGKLGTLLYELPGSGISGPGGLRLEPCQHAGGNNALALSGLPYGAALTLYATTADGVNVQLAVKPSASHLSVDLTADLTFGLGSGVQASGGSQLSFDLGPQATPTDTQLVIDAGFSGAELTLSLQGKVDTEKFPKIDLVPFGGLNQYLSGGTPKALLELLGGKLFGALATYQKAHPGSALVGWVAELETLTGIHNAAQLVALFKKLETSPLAAFEGAAAAQAMKVIGQLLSHLELPGFQVDGSLLRYSHTLRDSSISASVGSRKQNGQTVFGLWITPKVQTHWLALDLGETGITVALPPGSAPKVEFAVAPSLAMDLSTASIPGLTAGPALALELRGGLHAGLSAPSLRMYPIGAGSSAETLVVNLLPQLQLAYGNDPSPAHSAAAAGWLEHLGVRLLTPLVADLTLSLPELSPWLGKTIGQSRVTLGKILTDWGLLVAPSHGTYALNNLAHQWHAHDAVKIVTGLLFAALDALSGQTLISVDGGGVSIISQKDGSSENYGISLRIPDIELAPKSGRASLHLQLGKWIAGEDEQDNWISASDSGFSPQEPGVAFFLLKKKGDTLTLNPALELISVGLDVAGSDPQHPLVDVAGLTLGATELRTYLSVQAGGGSPSVRFGAAIFCDHLGLPLGPAFGSAGQNNPVVQNLLSSGSSGAGAVSPTFSASAAWVEGHSFTLQLYDADNQPTDQLMLPVQRAFGPVDCRQIGLGWQGAGGHPPDVLSFLLDGSVRLAGLDLDLQDLRVGIPVKTPTDLSSYQLALRGLDLTFTGGSTEISGGFLKSGSGYAGNALIRSGPFSFDALGAYDVVDGVPSLFAFVLGDTPLGGPPYFFVEGFAVGFGYNRALRLPAQDQVAQFPLVAGAMQPQALSGDLSAVLQKLASDVPPRRGEDWLAAGVHFSSFKLLDSFALLSIAFGTELQLGLLGLSTIQLPPSTDEDPVKPIVYAQLQLEASFTEKSGLLAITDVLTPSSYLLDPDCRLTGGFAFYTWFSGPHEGDFVVTLGGYAPSFVPPLRPSYYPQEPRLGFNWPVGHGVNIKGGGYFALTPSRVMAGGNLEATYHSGHLHAWFTAEAELLVVWKPFHYQVGIGVSVGASYRVDAWFVHHTFRVELGASLEISGPPFYGKAHIHWYVISFTVTFGTQPPGAHPPLSWASFDQAFLPQPKAGQGTPLCSVRVARGLLRKVQWKGSPLWLIQPQDLALISDSVIPSTAVSLNGRTIDAPAGVNTQIGIRPMQRSSLTSTHAITIEKENNQGTYEKVPKDTFEVSIFTRNIPAALWSPEQPPEGGIEPHQLVSDTMAGAELVPPAVTYHGVPPFERSQLAFQQDPVRDFTLDGLTPPTGPSFQQSGAVEALMKSVMDPAVAANRQAILAALADNAVFVEQPVELDLMAADAAKILLAPPMLVTLGGKVTT